MLGHRLRRWPNINPTLVQRLVRLNVSLHIVAFVTPGCLGGGYPPHT